MQGFVYDKSNQTLKVAIKSLDSTGATVSDTYVNYTRDSGLDVPGYEAYRIQEDALDRLFVALAATSDDGSVSAVTASDAGQFNKHFGGGRYSREGGFAPPTVGTGPGAGQVSYAGTYGAVTNLPVTRGSATDVAIPTASGTDTSLIPAQSARVAGDVFLNANFQDNSVNGSIYNRTLQDDAVGLTAGQALQTIVLVPTDIATDGTFAGTVEDPGQSAVGSYGGVFGGTNANSVAGLVNLSPGKVATDNGTAIPNSVEYGAFVLTQCGANNTSGLCTQTAP